jgi:hypothetical protein
MQTSRDQEIVQWVGELGAAGAAEVGRRFGMGRSWTYHRLRTLVRDGLLTERRLLYQLPGLYVATAEGLRWCGLERLGVYRVGPGSFEHARQVASTAAQLHLALPGSRVIGEREIRTEEAEQGELIASIKLGELPGGRPGLHRPDLALLAPNGRIAAVEVELSVKAPRRLHAICRGWARARHVDAAYYLAAPAPARAVARAITETRAEDRITVLPLAGAPELATAETEARSARR